MSKLAKSKFRHFLAQLGPGLITGASDDDPSGIATYAQTGAQFGLSMLWSMVFTYPLMASVQEISARIGRVTGRGLAANMRAHLPRPLVYITALVLVCANIVNIGADLGAMGASTQLLIGGSAHFYVVLFALLSMVMQIFIPYDRYVHALKWLTLALFAYVGTAFVVHVPWAKVLRATFIPSISLNGEYLKTFVAVLGTTISPYLFFWQASQEVEEVGIHDLEKPLKNAPAQALAQFARIRIDTYTGMAFSNVVAYFIILTSAITLNQAGVTDIQTAEQAASALRPIAGDLAFFLFAIGIVGTGFLAIPVLAGSAAYALGESFKWPVGLERKPRAAKGFYAIIAATTLLGTLQNLIKVSPIKALVFSAIINGVTAGPILILVMWLGTRKKVMKEFRIQGILNGMGWLTALVMIAAAVGLLKH